MKAPPAPTPREQLTLAHLNALEAADRLRRAIQRFDVRIVADGQLEGMTDTLDSIAQDAAGLTRQVIAAVRATTP